MRRAFLVSTSIALLGGSLLLFQGAVDAGTPAVYSVVEGRDSKSDAQVIVVLGNSLNSVASYNFANTDGVATAALELRLKSKNMLVLGLPPGVPSGRYILSLYYGKGLRGEQQHTVVVSNLLASPGSVIPESLDATLRTDLNDADTLQGQPGSYYNDALNLTGTVDVARFSAYADLVAESRIGGAADQLAVGDHLHDTRYVLRGGDTISAGFSASTDTGNALTGTSSAASARGVSGEGSGQNGVGVYGTATGTTGTVTGVLGTTAASGGRGVFGENTSTSGVSYGVHGRSQSDSGSAVFGDNTSLSTTGPGYGVRGRSAAKDGRGVLGEATDALGLNAGVEGTTASANGIGVLGNVVGTGAVGVFGDATSSTGGNVGVFGRSNSTSGYGVYATSQYVALYAESPGNNVVSIQGQSTVNGSAVLLVEAQAGTGVNIATFRSNGANRARIDNNGKGFFNGGTQTSGADWAESVAVDRPVAQFEPGDVIVIDRKAARGFALSAGAQSTLVAGVYSTKPGVLARPGDVANSDDWQQREIPLAIVGIVPTKVTDENGAIEPGDLLVSSSTPGHAMKAPADPRPGTVLGKALDVHASGRGRIEVLLVSR